MCWLLVGGGGGRAGQGDHLFTVVIFGSKEVRTKRMDQCSDYETVCNSLALRSLAQLGLLVCYILFNTILIL